MSIRASAPDRRRITRDAAYLKWIKTQPCAVCIEIESVRGQLSILEAGRRAGGSVEYAPPEPVGVSGLRYPLNLVRMFRTIEAAHVGLRGLGQKCSDREAIPLCAFHHRLGEDSHHKLGKNFWTFHGLDRNALIQRFQQKYAEEKAA